MGRRRNSARVVTLAPLGPEETQSMPERQRVAAMLARDAADREAEERRQKHRGYNDAPANLRNYETVDLDKTASQRRYRALPADHPLVKAWFKRKIPETEFNAGNVFRIIYERANDPRGHDSTQNLAVDRSRSEGSGVAAADVAACRASIEGFRDRMSQVDFDIVEKFCGIGLPLSAAVHSSVMCSAGGVLYRAREALRGLESAIKHAAMPEIAPELLLERVKIFSGQR